MLGIGLSKAVTAKDWHLYNRWFNAQVAHEEENMTNPDDFWEMENRFGSRFVIRFGTRSSVHELVPESVRGSVRGTRIGVQLRIYRKLYTNQVPQHVRIHAQLMCTPFAPP
jgi:hypothetical protein